MGAPGNRQNKQSSAPRKEKRGEQTNEKTREVSILKNIIQHNIITINLKHRPRKTS